MRLRSLSLAVLLAGCTGKPSQPALEASPQPEAPAAPAAPPTQPVPEAIPAPTPAAIVPWWCTCYARTGPEPVTACRRTAEECAAVQARATKGGGGIVAGSLTHTCRQLQAEHPGDLLGGRDRWKPSAKPGAWISNGACLLPGPPDVTPQANEEQEPEPPDVLKDESFGGLKLGISGADVVQRLGEPAKKGRPEEWGADGRFHHSWSYPDHGLALDLAGDKRTGPWTLASIRAKAPCTFRTSRGVGIGDPRSAVEAAYGKDREPGSEPDDEVFVAGSVYWGVFFSFDAKDRNVSEIFLGAGAE